MTFTSTTFLFFFLPLSLILFHLTKKLAIKDIILLLLSVAFYFYASESVKCCILFVVDILVNVIIGRVLTKLQNAAARKTLFYIGILFNIVALGYFKYTNFAIDIINDVLVGPSLAHKDILLPLGISFLSFKAISYLADIYHSKIQLVDNIFHDAAYLVFFTQVTSGPLARYEDFREIGTPADTLLKIDSYFSDGVYRFLIGFNKKVLIANALSNITAEVFQAPLDEVSASYIWLGSICYSIQIYFDFSGYSDMAIGLSEMFGYKCIENFKYPYMTESISKFWRRWHISLSQWFRDYVYIPLGGSKDSRAWKTYANLLVVWLLTGLWHGANWTFVIWGLSFFVMIALERLSGLPDRIKTKMGRFGYRIFTLLFINCTWIIFNSDSISKGVGMIKSLVICEGNPLASARAIYLLKDYWLFIIAGLLFCFPVVGWLESKIKDTKLMTPWTYFKAIGGGDTLHLVDIFCDIRPKQPLCLC